MKLLFALLIVIWWISVWGLADLAMEDWTRKQKAIAYVCGIALTLTTLWFFPHIADRL
jgi:hypothetical protein